MSLLAVAVCAAAVRRPPRRERGRSRRPSRERRLVRRAAALLRRRARRRSRAAARAGARRGAAAARSSGTSGWSRRPPSRSSTCRPGSRCTPGPTSPLVQLEAPAMTSAAAGPAEGPRRRGDGRACPGARVPITPGRRRRRCSTSATAADRLYLVERGRIALTLPMQVRGSARRTSWSRSAARRDRRLVRPRPPAPVHAEGHRADRAARCSRFPRAALLEHFARAPGGRLHGDPQRRGGDRPPAPGVPDDVAARDAARGRAALLLSGEDRHERWPAPAAGRARRARARRRRPRAPTSPAAARRAGAGEEHLEVPPPPFSRGDLPLLGLPRGPAGEPHAPGADRDARRHRAPARRAAPLVPGLPRRRRTATGSTSRAASGCSFEESYRLCGQCHGEKLRDWRAGVHGRRTGQWNGHKQYLLCAHCHNPHQPRFQPLAPEPAPRPPGATGGAREAVRP